MNIEKISLPNTLIEIGSSSFYGLNRLKYIYIPKSVKSIKEGAFIDCVNCTILVENDKDYYSTKWYDNVKEVKFNITREELKYEIIKILYSFDNSLTDDQREAFCNFTIDLFKNFPNFKFNYDDMVDLVYVVASEFTSYMETLIGVDEKELDMAINYIEKLHKDKHHCIQELATIGFVESIQNSWSDVNKKFIYLKMGSKTKKSWKNLNVFWEGK